MLKLLVLLFVPALLLLLTIPFFGSNGLPFTITFIFQLFEDPFRVPPLILSVPILSNLASNSRGGRFAEADAEDLSDGERKAASVFTVPLLSAAALLLLLLVEVEVLLLLLLLLPFLPEAFFFFLEEDEGADADADC